MNSRFVPSRRSPQFGLAAIVADQATSAFGRKDDLQIRAKLRRNRRATLSVDDFGYARFSPKDAVLANAVGGPQSGYWSSSYAKTRRTLAGPKSNHHATEKKTQNY
jgi:hypothetical protein